MNVIYKYPLAITAEQTLLLPIGAKVLSVQMQGSVPTVWTLQDASNTATTTEVLVAMVATGQEFDIDNWNYVDTLQDGSYVWHVFMRE